MLPPLFLGILTVSHKTKIARKSYTAISEPEPVKFLKWLLCNHFKNFTGSGSGAKRYKCFMPLIIAS